MCNSSPLVSPNAHARRRRRRLASSGVADSTQIRTHMCYSESNDIIDSIVAMDADDTRVPAEGEIRALLSKALEVLTPEQLWVNSDCGLKTRGWKEVDLALTNMVRTAAELRIATFLNLVARYMTEYSEKLDLEHRGSQLRLDIRTLTVVADTLNGPVPLSRMGSGENWVGYHVLAHLSLHKWFRQKDRPVPAFLFFDQPSQAHYPPEKDANGAIDSLKDEDQTAVTNLFKLIHDATNEIVPGLQTIVTDHADLKTDWFTQSVVARWRGSEKLIPESWYGSAKQGESIRNGFASVSTSAGRAVRIA